MKVLYALDLARVGIPKSSFLNTSRVVGDTLPYGYLFA